MERLKIGDPFPLSEEDVGDCPGMNVRTDIPVPALCVLDKGHPPPHVATDGERVVAVWDEEVEVWG